MGKIVKEISGLSQFELMQLQEELNAYNCASTHNPWETVYVVIENAHGFYGETEHGRYEDYKEAEKMLETFCSTYGGRIEVTTWGELERVTL